MMDNLAIRAAEAFVQAGYPLDAAAILLCELDGTPKPKSHEDIRAGARACSRRPAPPRCACPQDEAERLRFWAGRKAAFPAVGPHRARLLLHGRHHPAQARCREVLQGDRRAVAQNTACAWPTCSTPATATCIR